MDFSSGQYVQLIIALVLAGGLFVVAYTTPPRWVVVFVILFSPFQPISSAYGSINMVMIYLVGLAFLIRGRLKSWPLIWAVMLILLAYLMSLSQALAPTYRDHALYMLSIAANFITFYVVYNYLLRYEDARFAYWIFTSVAALVVFYCMLSLAVGFESVAVFGLDELTFGSNLEAKQRLNGPFDAPGTNAEFLALQIIMLAYLLIRERKWLVKSILISLMLASFAILVATGSRGGFVALVIGLILFAVAFRKDIGVKFLVKSGFLAVAFIGAAYLIISFTQFNVMFDRLKETEVHGLVLDSRVGIFESSFDKALQKPLMGHGPRIRLLNEEKRRIRGYEPLGYYPHNLYLFLFFTLGVMGLAAYLIFFIALMAIWWRKSSWSSDDVLLKGSPRLAIVLMLTFLVSQYRIEFLRFLLSDYQQYMFALWAMFLALTHRMQQPNVLEMNIVSDKKDNILSKKRILTTKVAKRL